MKLGDDCFVSTLPSNIFPVDIALGIQEIKKGNNATGEADEIQTQGVLVGLQPLKYADKNKLHPDIKSRCSSSEIKDFKEMPVTKEQSDDLRNGKIIFIDAKATKNTCQLMVCKNLFYQILIKNILSLRLQPTTTPPVAGDGQTLGQDSLCSSTTSSPRSSRSPAVQTLIPSLTAVMSFTLTTVSVMT